MHIVSICSNWIELVVTVGPPSPSFGWGMFPRASVRSWWGRKLGCHTAIPGHHLLRIVVLKSLYFMS